MVSKPTPKDPWPEVCPACKQWHNPAQSCPAFVKETTQDERDRLRVDAQEAEELERYDTQPHHGKPARKPPRPK